MSKQLGSEIRSARKTKQLTQTQLAEKCGLHTSEVSELETGKQRRIVKVEVAAKMASVLDLSLLRLLKLGRPEEWRVWVKAVREDATL